MVTNTIQTRVFTSTQRKIVALALLPKAQKSVVTPNHQPSTYSYFLCEVFYARSLDLIHTLVSFGSPHPVWCPPRNFIAGLDIVMTMVKRKGLESAHKMSFFRDGNLQNNWSRLSLPLVLCHKVHHRPDLAKNGHRRGSHPKDDSLGGIPDIAHVSTVNIVWSLSRQIFLPFSRLSP